MTYIQIALLINKKIKGGDNICDCIKRYCSPGFEAKTVRSLVRAIGH